MKKYHVIVRTTKYKDYEVTANSEEEAEEYVLENYKDLKPYDKHKPEITISALEIK